MFGSVVLFVKMSILSVKSKARLFRSGGDFSESFANFYKFSKKGIMLGFLIFSWYYDYGVRLILNPIYYDLF